MRCSGTDITLLIHVKSTAVDVLQHMATSILAASKSVLDVMELLNKFNVEHIIPVSLANQFTATTGAAIISSISKQIQEDIATLRRFSRVPGCTGINAKILLRSGNVSVVLKLCIVN